MQIQSITYLTASDHIHFNIGTWRPLVVSLRHVGNRNILFHIPATLSCLSLLLLMHPQHLQIHNFICKIKIIRPKDWIRITVKQYMLNKNFMLHLMHSPLYAVQKIEAELPNL